MAKRKKLKWLLPLVATLLVLAVLLLFYRSLQISADVSSITVTGKVTDSMLHNTPVKEEPVRFIGRDGVEHTAFTDSSGAYSVDIANPDFHCNYRVITGGLNYHAKSSFITLKKTSFAGSSGKYVMDFSTDKEVDLMHSNYFLRYYPSGYTDNHYHLSSYDAHYVRNKITREMVTDPEKVPTSVTLSLPIKHSLQNYYNYPPNREKPEVHAVFRLAAITSEWNTEKIPITYLNPSAGLQLAPAMEPPDCSKFPKGCIDINIGDLGDTLEFKSVDLSELTIEERYKAWLYGFVILPSFYTFDKEGNKIHSDINPDIFIARSEDNNDQPIHSLTYEDFVEGAIKTNNLVRPAKKSRPGERRFGIRYHPKLHYCRMHSGIDLSGGGTEPAYSMADGTIEYAGWSGGYGKQVRVKADAGETVFSYNHLSSIAVATGQKVAKGQKVGNLGNTGLSKGVHLHFEIIINGKRVNPWPYLRCLYPRSDEANEKPDPRC